ncbi:hypothetical protein I4F81_001548 [Pyropia yezoensis]|uniref:Uncharacterized protein n=1 Tax=Pyropia yezoensis TaxID=2788 RepID=A0ACC3BLU1_PYRYE|nr:hypothetical protein I4F81_001548 [Neopyropia yezoensis]
MAAKRIGFWARTVFGMRSPKAARIESRRDASVAVKGQTAAFAPAAVAAFLASTCAAEPAGGGADEPSEGGSSGGGGGGGPRVFSPRFFRLRLAVSLLPDGGGGGGGARGVDDTAADTPPAGLDAPDRAAWAPSGAPPGAAAQFTDADKALLGRLLNARAAAAVGVRLVTRPGADGGAPVVTGMVVPPALLLSPHPALNRALCYPQHGSGGVAKRRSSTGGGGGAASPPLPLLLPASSDPTGGWVRDAPPPPLPSSGGGGAAVGALSERVARAPRAGAACTPAAGMADAAVAAAVAAAAAGAPPVRVPRGWPTPSGTAAAARRRPPPRTLPLPGRAGAPPPPPPLPPPPAPTRRCCRSGSRRGCSPALPAARWSSWRRVCQRLPRRR